MSERTGIIWTERTWNPMSGCKKVSAGCAFCYAMTIAENRRGSAAAFPKGFDLTLRPHKLEEPLRRKKPTLYFVNSMSDLFWDEIPVDYLNQIVGVIEQANWHEFQVLTKRPERMRDYFKERNVPSNFWVGTTVENWRCLGRLDIIREIKAEIRFVSFEPLLEDLGNDYSLDGIHWAITGGESGKHLYKDKWTKERALVNFNRESNRWEVKEDAKDWVRNIRTKCRKSGTHFFHKQWGGNYPEAAGRILDGETFTEIPRLPGSRKEIENAYLKKLEGERQLTLF